MAAYRRNSTGPRTIAGKLRSSYNALRHGLAASDPRRLVPPGAAGRLAGAICDDDEDPVLFTAALAIAENEWAKEIGVGWCALQQRLAKGWPPEQALSAGNRELFKGKPALAPLARKAGVSARLALYRRAAGHPMEKVLQPGLLPHPPQHPVTFNGQTKRITAWANELGISPSALSNRLSRGWPLERALSWRRKPKE
jgi:hypothetical protein